MHQIQFASFTGLALSVKSFRSFLPVSPGFLYHSNTLTGQLSKQMPSAADPKVKSDYQAATEEIKPLGVHGTFVAVDWDSCVADGICLVSCPVKVFEWYKDPGEAGSD